MLKSLLMSSIVYKGDCWLRTLYNAYSGDIIPCDNSIFSCSYLGSSIPTISKIQNDGTLIFSKAYSYVFSGSVYCRSAIVHGNNIITICEAYDSSYYGLIINKYDLDGNILSSSILKESEKYYNLVSNIFVDASGFIIVTYSGFYEGSSRTYFCGEIKLSISSLSVIKTYELIKYSAGTYGTKIDDGTVKAVYATGTNVLIKSFSNDIVVTKTTPMKIIAGIDSATTRGIKSLKNNRFCVYGGIGGSEVNKYKGSIIVLDKDDNFIFGKAIGEYLGTNFIRSVTEDVNGNIYVTCHIIGDGLSAIVVKFDSDGNYIWQFRTSKSLSISSICIGNDGNLYLGGYKNLGELQVTIKLTESAILSGSVIFGEYYIEKSNYNIVDIPATGIYSHTDTLSTKSFYTQNVKMSERAYGMSSQIFYGE